MKARWCSLFDALVDQQLGKCMVNPQHELDRMTDEGCPHDNPLELPGDIPLSLLQESGVFLTGGVPSST